VPAHGDEGAGAVGTRGSRVIDRVGRGVQDRGMQTWEYLVVRRDGNARG
jgi:hypothetical protein